MRTKRKRNAAVRPVWQAIAAAVALVLLATYISIQLQHPALALAARRTRTGVFVSPQQQGPALSSVGILGFNSLANLSNATSPQAGALWNLSIAFTGGNATIIGNFSSASITARDNRGRTVTAEYGIQIAATANQQKEIYLANLTAMHPVYLLSSATTTGYVRGATFQNASAAPACAASGRMGSLYTEWDYVITVQPSYGTQKNVVAARDCIYRQTIGYEYSPAPSPVPIASSGITITSNGKTEDILADYLSGNSASSNDGLALVSWNGTQITVPEAPNQSAYVLVNSTSRGWIAQYASSYSRWALQYGSFTTQKITQQRQSYSPSSIAALSQGCSGLASSTTITNASIIAAAQCMNATVNVYSSLGNQLAAALGGNGVAIAGYQTAPAVYNGMPGVSVDLPSVFVEKPRFGFLLSSALIGATLPTGVPRIVGVNVTPIGLRNIGSVNLQVANIGAANGTFGVSIRDCPGLSTQQGISYSIPHGQIANISAAISATNSSAVLNEQCAVTVSSMEGGASTSRPVLIMTTTPNQYMHDAIEAVGSYGCGSPLTRYLPWCVPFAMT